MRPRCMRSPDGPPVMVVSTILAILVFFTALGTASAQILYALEKATDAQLHIVDRETCAIQETIGTVSFTDPSTAVSSFRGMAMSPTTGRMYVSGLDYPNPPRVFEVDLSTVALTEVARGSVALRDLTFDSAGNLYGVSGAVPTALYEVDLATGTIGLTTDLSNSMSNGLAFNPYNPGVVYKTGLHTDLQVIDLSTGSVSPIDTNHFPSTTLVPLGAVYDPISDLIRVPADVWSPSGSGAVSWFTLTLEGSWSATPHQCSKGYFGLAFDQATTSLSPVISVVPAQVDFGRVLSHLETERVLTVTNAGLSPLTVSSVEISGANTEDFAVIEGGGSFALDPGDAHEIVLRHLSVSVGARSSALDIYSNDIRDPVLEVQLLSTARAAPVQVLTPSGLVLLVAFIAVLGSLTLLRARWT